MNTRGDDTMMQDDDVDRLYGALVDAIEATRPASFAAPVTVAEIYQDLVPYRQVRAALGFEMNADYEHTLLRLLAGIGELARLEPLEAAAELREELDSPNPNVGLFRKFAGCDVWVSPPESGAPAGAPAGRFDDEVAWAPPAARHDGHGGAGFETPDGDAGAGAGAGVDAGAADADGDAEAAAEPAAFDADAWDNSGMGGAAGGVEAADAGAASSDAAEPADDEHDDEPEYELVPVKRPRIVPSAAAALEGRPVTGGATVTPIDRSGGAHCAFCDSRLPARAAVRFCPFCGNDQAQRPCGSCREPLDPDWRYCVACGSAAVPS